MTDVDRDRTLCASLAAEDNIPKVGKSLGTDGQRHVLSAPKTSRTWQDLPHWDNWAADTGSVLWLLRRRHTVTAGVQTLWFTWSFGSETT